MNKDDLSKIKDILKSSGLKGDDLKNALRELVGDVWPETPPWSDLDKPLIEESQKASVGAGVALTFVEKGVRKIVLLEAGPHYKNQTKTSYMIPGGFVNLSRTEGSSLVPASTNPEQPHIGAAREVEEELKKPDGSPFFKVDPKRLIPMDVKSVPFAKDITHLVVGYMLELTPIEAELMKEHVEKMAKNAAYKQHVSMQTINPTSNRPEVAGVRIFNLSDAVKGKIHLLHADQKSLFKKITAHFARIAKTPANKNKPPKPPMKFNSL